MINTQNFKRLPAIRCWIKHILEGQYANDEKFLYTIFGRLKRVRFNATIINKHQIKINNIEEDDLSSNLRIEFDLDDGTGLINAILWRGDREIYNNFKKGEIVDIIGLIRYTNNISSISIEIIKKIENPDFILLRNAEIIKKIKTEELSVIPEVEKVEVSDDLDIDLLFDDQKDSESDPLKEQIYSFIEESSQQGNGISLTELKYKINVSEAKLRSYIKDLEMESRIYQSEENTYQSFL